MTGACPHDAANVKCCIKQTCQLDRRSGDCEDKTRLLCPRNYWAQGLCPGSADVQCCVDSLDSSIVVNYIRKIFDLAGQYRATGSGKRSANQLVMEWLRHKAYNDIAFKALIGGVDSDWIDFANSNNLEFINTLPLDPLYGEQEEYDHLGATMNGHYLVLGEPSDVAGWAGDLFTFYREWRHSDIDSGYDFAVQKLMKPGQSSTFKLLDGIEDADGFNMAFNLKVNASRTIVEEFEDLLKPYGGYTNRFKNFFLHRFDGSKSTASSEAKKLLLTDDPLIVLGRTKLIESDGPVKLPGWLSDKDLNAFCDGFAEVLSSL